MTGRSGDAAHRAAAREAGRARGAASRPSDEERLERLERWLERFREEADAATVVVEGSRDLEALARLGIGGHQVAVHKGRGLEYVVEELCLAPQPVILLVDWDRTGSRLHARMVDELRARVRLDTDTRRRLVALVHVRSFEEVPAELAALRGLDGP